ncbi:MAG TPA: glycosyltransferase family 39 protein [Blastocatellia bacterium]|nr:glycosyltransferase family 39 protein [Blastocatellia bacterium]
MQQTTRKKILSNPEIFDSTPSKNRTLIGWNRSRQWLAGKLAPQTPAQRRRLVAVCIGIFGLALGVRFLHLQDRYPETVQRGPAFSALTRSYEKEAQRMVEERRILFPSTPVDPGDAGLIVHPPGYSAFIAAISLIAGNSGSNVTLAQIILDAVSSIVVFLIAAELFNRAIAIIAAVLVALSPHFSYYSLWLSPDTLPVLPILIAVYLLIKASRHPRLSLIIAAGVMLGISCWLRANGMLLAPFLGASVVFFLKGKKGLLYALALVGTVIIVVSPITIRNWLLYHRFIPLSVDAGLALIEGIADYDQERRFGLPQFDVEAAPKDVEWHNRPEYIGNLWSPDGIERDAYRFRRGLEVIRSNPVWFANVMLDRGLFMLRYDQSRKAVWPFTTASAPLVSAAPGFGHNIVKAETQSQLSAGGPDLLKGGSALTAQTQTSTTERQSLQVTGDASDYGDQFTSAPFAVDPDTDYLMAVSAELVAGEAAVKVTSVDRRITLSSGIVPKPHEKRRKRDEKEQSDTESASEPRPTEVLLPFASGHRNEVLFVISNNGASPVPPVLEINKVAVYKVGATPHQWTRLVRPLVRGIQRNLFTTWRMLPLVMIGVALLAITGNTRGLLALLIVPLYYVVVHSVFHTEYRYILAIHYFLLVAAATTLYSVGSLLIDGARAVPAFKSRAQSH